MNVLNHIAILVSSVERSAAVLIEHGFEIGPKEIWEGEGTAEIYVGARGQAAKLLLMEPVKPGAYARAMEKRGAGIHHIAVDVLDLEGFIDSLGTSGWLVHPKSLKMIAESRTAYLARPGFGMLIEVQQREPAEMEVRPAFITKLAVSLTAKEQEMVAALGIIPEQLGPSEDGRSWLYFSDGDVRVAIDELTR